MENVMSPSAHQPGNCLVLEAELTIRQAAELREQLLQACAAGVSALDLSGVTEFDSAGLQLLVACQRSANELGRSLQLRTPSPTVQPVGGAHGLCDWLDAAAAA
jgi:anti-sigma B factor antagonist